VATFTTTLAIFHGFTPRHLLLQWDYAKTIQRANNKNNYSCWSINFFNAL